VIIFEIGVVDSNAPANAVRVNILAGEGRSPLMRWEIYLAVAVSCGVARVWLTGRPFKN